MDFLEGIWEPLLKFVSSEYGPPRQLNNVDCAEFMSNPGIVNAKNWTYEVPKEYDMKNSTIYKYLNSILYQLPSVRPGHTCLLKVSIPARDTHPFWKLDPTMEAEYKLYIWDMVEGALEFEVCRWGINDDSAKFNATCHAKDIIRNIRSQINSPQPYTKLLLGNECAVLQAPEQEQECKILHMGKMLNSDWRKAEGAFNVFSINKERGFAQFIYNDILSLEPASPLLRYYSVFPSCIALTIDIFPSQNETIYRGSRNLHIIVDRDMQRTNSSFYTTKVRQSII
jgi:hypothetical protein